MNFLQANYLFMNIWFWLHKLFAAIERKSWRDWISPLWQSSYTAVCFRTSTRTRSFLESTLLIYCYLKHINTNWFSVKIEFITYRLRELHFWTKLRGSDSLSHFRVLVSAFSRATICVCWVTSTDFSLCWDSSLGPHGGNELKCS